MTRASEDRCVPGRRTSQLQGYLLEKLVEARTGHCADGNRSRQAHAHQVRFCLDLYYWRAGSTGAGRDCSLDLLRCGTASEHHGRARQIVVTDIDAHALDGVVGFAKARGIDESQR